MKKPSDNIFRLIQAMSPAEKRYFKRHYASDQSIIIKLFDFINSLNSYNEEVVKGHFGEKIVKNLKVYKIQLYDLILKSLVSYHQKNNIVSKIRAGLEEMDILIEKHLYDQAQDRLQKIKRLALKYQEFTYLIEIVQKEFHLFHLRHDQQGISKHPIFGEMNQAITEIKTYLAFSELGHQLVDTSRKRNTEVLSAKERVYFEGLLQSELLQIDPHQLPFKAQLSRNALLSLLYRLLNYKEEDYQVRKANVDLFSKYPHFKDSMPFSYIGALRNYLNFCGQQGMENEVKEVLKEVVNFVEDHKKMEIHLIHFYYVELVIHFQMAHFDYILQYLEPKIKKHIKKHKLKEERILGLIYPLLITTYLLSNNHVMVQSYFRKVEAAKANLNDYVIAFMQILELVSHYESKDEFLIERLLASWQRKKKTGTILLKTTPFYEDCLELIKKMIKKPFEKVELAKIFIAHLTRYLETKDRVYLAFREHFLDYWLKAIVARRSFSEEMQERKEKLAQKDARQLLPGTSRLV